MCVKAVDMYRLLCGALPSNKDRVCQSSMKISVHAIRVFLCSQSAGYYEDGEFGIRIENLLIIQEADTPFQFGDQPYLSFARLTLCPLQRKMIDLEVRCCCSITNSLV